MRDFVRLRNVLLGVRKLNEIEKLAVYTNLDGNSLNILDLVRIRRIILYN